MTQDKRNLWFLSHCNGKEQEEVDLTYNKKIALYLRVHQAKRRKHHKLLQPYFCTHLHRREVSRSVSLFAIFCKNNNYLGLHSAKSKMLKNSFFLHRHQKKKKKKKAPPPTHHSQKSSRVYTFLIFQNLFLLKIY